MLHRKPRSGDSGRSICGMFLPLEAHAYRVCDKTKCDASFGRRRPGAGSTVTFSSMAAGAFRHGRQPGADPKPVETSAAGIKQLPTLRLVDARAEPMKDAGKSPRLFPFFALALAMCLGWAGWS